MQDLNGSPVHLRVPVGKSPVDGKPTALVTVIMFGGYQDPFSYRSLAALSELQKKYGDDLRLVWKDHPLPFHEVAIPLLLAAQYARQQRGDTGFWQAFHVIFQQHERLSKANAAIAKANQSLIAAGKPSKPIVRFDAKAFGDIARSLKISAARQKEMLATKDKPASIADDLELAHLVRIQGTPTFFINGRRLVGAQPLESFTKVIDEELIVAREQVASGVSRDKVYETLQARALRPRPRAERPTPDPAGAGMGPPTP
jgi:protein-disulfide isomerase